MGFTPFICPDEGAKKRESGHGPWTAVLPAQQEAGGTGGAPGQGGGRLQEVRLGR